MGQGVLTSGFVRSERGDAGAGALHCEGVPIARIAKEVGTPFYVYSSAVLRDRYSRLDEMLSGLPHRIHYTLKANSNRAILQLLREIGAGADVVSGGELQLALAAGFEPNQILFGGVGKTEEEIREGVRAGVLALNVESGAEMELIARVARDEGVRARVGLRVNPELTLRAAHDYIKTGEKGHKFGIPYDEVIAVARIAAKSKHLELVGLDMHLGSQLSRIEPYRAGTERLLELYGKLKRDGMGDIRYLDIGGGLGVRYDSEEAPDLERFASLILPLVEPTGLTLIMEPGRFIVGNAGALIATVLYRKKSGGKQYIITDAGMTELLRPSHYGAYHRIEAVVPREERTVADVVGPVCESGDFLALEREVTDVQPGDQIVVYDVGAYGYAMASNYNARRRAPEVLVEGDRFAITTRRETYEDLARLAIDDPAWRS